MSNTDTKSNVVVTHEKDSTQGSSKPIVQSKPTVNTVKKIRRSSSDPVSYKRPTMAQGKIYYDRNIDANYVIDPEIWSFLFTQCQENLSYEIAGYAFYEPNEDGVNEIIWAAITSGGSSGHVNSSNEDETYANTECMKEYGKLPNIQLHTHPTFDVYFSGTDINDIVNTIDTLMEFSDKGRYTFIVYNRTSALVRVVEWSEKGAYYNDGKLILLGTEIDSGEKKNSSFGGSVTQYTGQYGGSSKVNGYASQTYYDYDESAWYDLYYKGGALSDTSSEGKDKKEYAKKLHTTFFDWYSEANEIRAAVRSGRPIHGILQDLGYYAIRSIKARLVDGNENMQVAAMQTALLSFSKDDEAVDDTMKEIARYLTGSNGISSVIYLLDLSPWRVAEDVLADLNKDEATKELAALLDWEHDGICPPAIKLLWDENCASSRSAEEIDEANKKLIRSIPSDAISSWNKWINAYNALMEKLANAKS